MPINSILNEQARVLAQICPVCRAASGTLCLESYYNAGGKGSKHTNIFHAERVVAAQSTVEKVLDVNAGTVYNKDTQEWEKR